MNSIYEDFVEIINRTNVRFAASEILDVEGMEEAIINELRDRGFNISEED